MVDVAGAECGDAALLKLARSLFMKSLEALVIEFEAAIAPLAGRDIVVGSIERNLGERFTAFSRMLIETDRIHAARRSRELEEAIAILRRMMATGIGAKVIETTETVALPEPAAVPDDKPERPNQLMAAADNTVRPMERKRKV